MAVLRPLIFLSLLAIPVLAQQPPALPPDTQPQGTPAAPPPNAEPSPAANPPLSAAPEDPETLSPSDIARRDELLKPGLALLRKNDPDGAYKAFWPVRKAFPDDLRTLRYSAEAAFFSGHDREALYLFERALLQHPAQPWPLRLALLQTEARLDHWDDFNRDLATLRTTKREATDHQLDSATGFLIDGFDAGPGDTKVHIQTVIFPLQSDPYHTLYRFLLPKESPAKTRIQAGVNSEPADNDDHCTNPDFRPYVDLESDDVDQAAFKQAHPELAEKGERSYSLDTYPAPCSQGLIKFYSAGEPTYQQVRADVIRALSTASQTGAPSAETPTADTPRADKSAPAETGTKPDPKPEPTPEAAPTEPRPQTER